MKVIAVIVTYNRLELLKKCLAAVKAQNHPADKIIIINNGSTDNTLNWLRTQNVTYYTQDNGGGAGGFYYGIKEAYQQQAEWIWVMDDDTIPKCDALEKMLDVLNELGAQQHDIGFLSGTVLWTDGNIHEMNKTYVLKEERKLAGLIDSVQIRWPLIQFGTFVSMLISAIAVEMVGLPIKEYFIWNDDVEYTKRIVGAGLAGLAVSASIAVHETPTNYMASVFKDDATQLWKYKYGLRNELFTKRLHEGKLQFWTSWIHRILIMPFRIALNRKTHRWAFIKIIWQTSIAAVSFRPVIEHVVPVKNLI